MLELGTSTQNTPDVIKDTSESAFMADVVEASQQVPVIVDFWAPWCGPCKTLGPMLEDAVKAQAGKVKLVKLNMDEAQQIAAQLRIQSLPTVYAFYQGQPVDGFQGAIPGSEVTAFVERVAAQGGGATAAGEGGDPYAEALQAAEQMLTEGAASDAAQTFAAILGEDGRNAAAYGGLVRAHLALDDIDQAEAVLNGAPAEIAEAAELEEAHAKIQLARQAAGTGPIADLRASVEADPNDHQARYDLALALYAAGGVEEAVDQLLELFRRDREWNDGAAKRQLLTIFEAQKPTDPVVQKGRRRLSSMVFA